MLGMERYSRESGMKRYLALYDEHARFTYLSGTVDGFDYSPEDLVGTFPWEWVMPEVREQNRRTMLKVWATHETERYVIDWTNPHDPSVRRFFFHEVFWVGQESVSAIGVTWELPGELNHLSDSEMIVLEYLGEGMKAKEVASEMGVTPSTIYTHIERIQRKMCFDDSAQLAAFAPKYKSLYTTPD